MVNAGKHIIHGSYGVKVFGWLSPAYPYTSLHLLAPFPSWNPVNVVNLSRSCQLHQDVDLISTDDLTDLPDGHHIFLRAFINSWSFLVPLNRWWVTYNHPMVNIYHLYTRHILSIGSLYITTTY